MNSEMESKCEIITDFDSVTLTSVYTMSSTVSVATLNSEQEQGDLNSVCVKIETDEWYNTAADLYPACAKSEQVLWEEKQLDCNKQDGFNEVHEQTGCLQMDQDYAKHDVFTSECVKSEQTEYEIMQQDVTNSVCVNRNMIANSNAYTAQNELYSVCGKTKQSLNPITEQNYITTNDLNYVCVIAKQYTNTGMDNETANDPNALCNHTHSKKTEKQAKLADKNSVFLASEEIRLSNVDQYCTRPTVDGETITLDHCSDLNVQRHSNYEKDDSDIYLERDKRKRESCHSTLTATKRFRGQDSSSRVVQPRSPSARESAENAVTTAVPLFLKPAKITLNEKGDQVKNVKRMKKAKNPQKDKTEYNFQLKNLASCMNLAPRENGHFLYCGQCNKEFEGDCPVHGPYIYIQDKETLKEGKPSHFVDAQNKATSTWIRYVNCSMTKADQNLVAVQYKGGIFYCTLKQVSPGEELLVWNGDEFARELGLIRDKNVCSYYSKNSGHLEIHMRKHTGERHYKCEVCGYLCKQSCNLKTHMRIHTGERPYKCEECDFACNQSGVLKRHMRIHTGKREYACEVCGYECNRNENLKTHMRIHTGEREYKCGVCAYECNHSGNLQRHLKIHTGEREYKCEECGYACIESGTLKTHMMIHTGERPYKCAKCDFASKHSGDLTRHMRIHTGERPYKCEVCCYECNHSSNLKIHMWKHTGERPYKCEVCGFLCKQSGQLKLHMRIHTADREYKCGVCGYECNRSGNLQRHMKIHTGETVQV